jgi:MFS superfamily sulfate permease-like transporter
MDKTKEFLKDKIDQVENLDDEDMETLFMVIKSLNDRGKKIRHRKLNQVSKAARKLVSQAFTRMVQKSRQVL